MADAPQESTGNVGTEERRRRRKKLILWFVGGATAFALAVGGFFLWSLWSSLNNIKRGDLLPDRPPATAADVTELNFLITGVDERPDNGPTRSDVVLLAKIPTARDKVYVTWLPSGGQPPAGVRLDHAVQIDFAGFVGLTKQLGGVTVNNKVASKVGSYNWPKGQITVSGDEALAYVREYSDLEGEGATRSERQRAVAQAIVQKLFSRDLLTDPLRLRDVILQLTSFMTVDKELTNDVLIGLIASMRLQSSADIVIG